MFKVTPTGTLTTLYNFCSQPNCVDGSYPESSALALGTDGNFYGTTQNGGANGIGTVFKITPEGAYSVLHSFDGTDGNGPDAGLLLASEGNFYGTTTLGGSIGCGEVYKITPAGAVTTVHSFIGVDGCLPSAPLIQGTDSKLYGTTLAGGQFDTCTGSYGNCGTVFKVSTGGTFTSLLSFDGSNGALPFAPLIQASDGKFYGTTFSGGYETYSYEGTVFSVSSSGEEGFFYSFQFGVQGSPYAGLVQATDGTIYGEAFGGSPSNGQGYIFSVSPTAFKIVYSSLESGGYTSAMIQGTDGKLYGPDGDAVFSFDVGLGPCVTFVVPASRVGQTVQLLGQGFTGTTSVTFNGVAASKYTVVSDTYLTAVVPKGATTGTVVVDTPSGSLKSNVSFRVIE